MERSQGHGPDGAAPAPRPEARRADAARRLLVEGSRTAALDRLGQLATRLMAAPVAEVSLLGDVRTVVGGAGVVAGAPPHREEPLEVSLCALAAAQGRPLVVPDARADPRVADLPLVRAGEVVAYLGVPLSAEDGATFGALCVFGPTPRAWTDADVVVLQQLADSAVAELELSALSAEYESSRLRWLLAIDAAGVGGFDWDLVSGRLSWDDRLVELFGYDRSTFDETIEAFDARVHPEDLPRVSAALREAVDRCGEYEAEYRVQRPDGSVRWVQARGRALPDGAGRAVRLLGAAYDTTAVHEGEARVSDVLEAMSAAFFSVDRQWRFEYVNAEAERLLRRSRSELVGADLWTEFPDAVGSDFERSYRAVMDEGRPATFEAYYPAPLDAWYEVRAWPLPDGMSVYFLDVSRRRAAQERADRAAARLELLVEVSAALAETLEPRAAVARLARLVVPALADWCLVSLVDDDGSVRDVGWWHADPALRPVLERYAQLRQAALSDRSFVAAALRTGRPAHIDAEAARRVREVLDDEEARQLLDVLAPDTGAVLPLRGRGRTLGLLSVFRGRGGPPVGDDDLATAEEVAARAGLALDNARLYDQQKRLSEDLQRGLLTDPPEPDHAQVVVRYAPAAEAAQVGGDWYDAFLQPSGDTVLVIGDVVGHDSAAAAAMGQLRGLLRGIAFHSGSGPAAVLAGLDAAMEGLQVETTATAAVVRLEQTPDERSRGVSRVRWSSAGHPPPMVIGPDGSVLVLSGVQADLLLGIDPGTRRVESVLTVDRGTTVLLYTDGLVERRDQSLEAGLALLRDALAELAPLPLEELCDALLARLLPARAEDDVALVAVRLHLQDRPRPVEAGPNRVPPTVPDER